MDKKTLKIWFSICGAFAGLAIIYYIIRIFDHFLNDRSIEGTLLEKLNVVAIIFLIIALGMLLLTVPISNMIEKRSIKVDQKKASDTALLEKYKSKRNK